MYFFYIYYTRLRGVPPATLQAANSACTGPARTWFLCKTWCFCITRFLCKTTLCVKHGFDAKTWLLFKPQFKPKLKPKHVCKPGFWTRPYIERLCAQKVFGTKASGSSIGYKKRWSKTDEGRNNRENESKKFKTKPVLSEGQRKERWRRTEDEEELHQEGVRGEGDWGGGVGSS